MRHILLFFILSLIPLSAQAIIPLDLVAEFNLPENTTAWDVQHWMDDSTFGWAALRRDTTVQYALRAEDEPLSFELPFALFDSANWSRQEFQAIHLMRLEARPNAPIIAISTEMAINSGGIIERFHMLHVFDLEEHDLLYYNRAFTGYYSDSQGWNYDQSTEQLSSWPPAPAFANAIYRQNRRVADLDAAGTNRLEITHWTRRFDIIDDSLYVSFHPGQFDFFSNTNGDLVFNNSLEGQESDGSDDTYGEVSVEFYDAELNQTFERLICDTPCLIATPCAINTNLNGRFVAIGNVLFSVPALETIDTIEWNCDFTLAIGQGNSEHVWSQHDDRFLVKDIVSNLRDSTTSIGGNFSRTIKHFSGDGEIAVNEVVNGSTTNRILVYKPNGQISGIEDRSPSLSSSFTLQVFPNPFNATTSLKIEVSRADSMTFYSLM
ncbi:MAG: hypothetical protein IPP40_17275 [bacterium]|nr:hypothetical protein [bacterium]